MENSETKEFVPVTKSMLDRTNRFIALEGVDCTGKNQITSIIEKKGIGIPGVKTLRVDFPQYDIPSGKMITKYLNGDYGDASRMMEPVPNVAPQEWIGLVMNRVASIEKEINFIARLYSLNRIEYFRLNPPAPDTVYIFDRYQYSNAIHQISLVNEYMSTGEGAALSKALWSFAKHIGSMDEEISMPEFVQERCNEMIRSMYGGWTEYEKTYEVPSAFTFMLSLDADTVIKRMKARKESKHSGTDILEMEASIRRACNFVSSCQSFHELNDVYTIDVKELDENNDAIANAIIGAYHELLREGAEPSY